MNTGSGSRRPLSKVHGNSAISGRLPLICLAALALLGAGLVLASCGGLSLNGLLLNEEMGEFQVSPGSANVAVGTKLSLTGSGGFKPYSFDKSSGGGSVGSSSGVYQAPATVAVGNYEQAEIQGTDYAGGTATTTLTVFNPLTLNVGLVTIAEGGKVDFDADGGVPDYSFYVDSTLAHSSADGTWASDDWPDASTFLVEVMDSIGNVAAATVTVLDPSGPLAIDPAAVSVEQGGTVNFTGINVTGTGAYTDAAAGGSFDPPNGDNTTYTAPAAPFEGEVTVTLEDDIDSVTATVYVYDPADPPGDLTITPSAVGVDLGYGDTLIFTAAGGILPYTFSIDPDDLYGTIEKIAYNQARYTAPSSNTVDWVQLTDAVGTTLRVKVKTKG
jgi:hypothetical protein